MSVLKITNLKKYYKKQRGVENVNLTVEEGEIFGFIGPNGAGKSTTIRCALSLIFPDAGRIEIFGKDAIKDRVDIAKKIGYLPGEVFYYERMKVKELLRYSASFYPGDHEKRCLELCSLLELDTNKRIESLSLGNKKKVGIVQGLLHRPQLIVLDEPTAGLDPLMQQRFFELIKQEREDGATIFFSSHILSEVKKLCDRIAIIKDGVVVDVERMGNLVANDYKKVFLEAEEAELIKVQDRLGQVQDKKQGERVTLFRGDINVLLKALSAIKVLNLRIEEPGLDEIFMHYYEREANDDR